MLKFTDPELQKYYESIRHTRAHGVTPDTEDIFLLMGMLGPFGREELQASPGDRKWRPSSPRLVEIFGHLTAPENRAGLRKWYLAIGNNINPTAMETRELLSEMIGERLGPTGIRNALTKDLSPYIMPWLAPLAGIFFLFVGVTGLYGNRFELRGLVWHGWPALLRNACMLLWSGLLFIYSMFWWFRSKRSRILPFLLPSVFLALLITAAIFSTELVWPTAISRSQEYLQSEQYKKDMDDAKREAEEWAQKRLQARAAHGHAAKYAPVTDEELILKWRSRKTSIAEIEAGNAQMGASDTWKAFKTALRPGDEIWYFCSPGPLWEKLMGWEGYAIFRNNKLVKTFTLREN